MSLFLQVAFDKLTVDSAHQQANAAVAAATAADKQAGFDIRMAKAEHDAGGMKASYLTKLMSSHFSHSPVPDPSLSYPLPDLYLRMPLISSLWITPTSRPVQ